MRSNSSKNGFANNMLVSFKGQNWLDKQREAGRITATALLHLQKLVEAKTSLSLLELDAITEEYIISQDGIPTFKGYGKSTNPFPAACCMSVNKQLVHGVPTYYHLQEGDVVSFDLGVTVGGAIADSALTCIYGQPRSPQHVRLVEATHQALMAGIQAIQVGKRLGCIGQAIYQYARSQGFSVVTNYGGHGLDWNIPHASPFVANRADSNEGIRIQTGLAIAIEPMLVIGSATTTTGSDGWTVSTHDIGAHTEHSVFVHEDRVEIITDRSQVQL